MNAVQEGRKIVIDGVPVCYREQGEGPVLLYLHGNTGCGLWFSKVMDIPGYRTIAPDMPNFGDSGRIPSCEVAEYARWMTRFADALDLSDCIPAGHSLGGAVAQSMAVESPDRWSGLILIDSCPVDGFHTPEERYPAIEAYRDNREILKHALGAVMSGVKDDALVELLTDKARQMKREAFLGHAKALGHVDFREKASRFRGPVVYILGDRDILISQSMAEETMGYYRGRVVLIPGAGHSVMLEDPKGFKSEVKEFLKQYG